MPASSSSSSSRLNHQRQQWLSVGRAVGGAVIFGMPLMMTMEMWLLAFYIDPFRLLLLLLASTPVLVGVSSVIGFTDSRQLLDNVIDVFVAYAFGFGVSISTLFLFHVVSADNAVGMNFNALILQTVPASLGALLARSELGSGEHDRTEEKSGADELVVLVVGALFLALNVVPTDEIAEISYQMTAWHLLILFLLTCLIMYVFVIAGSYSAAVREKDAPDTLLGYIHYTCLACLVALMVSAFILWVFGRTDGLSFSAAMANIVVLLFPAGIGASAARLIL